MHSLPYTKVEHESIGPPTPVCISTHQIVLLKWIPVLTVVKGGKEGKLGKNELGGGRGGVLVGMAEDCTCAVKFLTLCAYKIITQPK